MRAGVIGRFLGSVVGGAVLLVGAAASAADQPISGHSVKLTESRGRTYLAFVSRDPAFLFPAVGSADDPATGSPGGLLVEVLSGSQPTASASAPPGVGNPGWKVAQRLVTYPACGGTCAGGRECVPLDLAGTAFCVCATPSLSCDDLACGAGLHCPSGEICTVGSSGGVTSCSCEPA